MPYIVVKPNSFSYPFYQGRKQWTADRSRARIYKLQKNAQRAADKYERKYPDLGPFLVDTLSRRDVEKAISVCQHLMRDKPLGMPDACKPTFAVLEEYQKKFGKHSIGFFLKKRKLEPNSLLIWGLSKDFLKNLDKFVKDPWKGQKAGYL